METNQISKIGLVFSGGLARGAAQLSFAKQVIEKVGYERIKVLSASSIGSLNAYSVSCGTYEDMLSFYERFDCDSVKAFKLYIKSRLFNEVFQTVEKEEMRIPTYVTGTHIFDMDTFYFYLNDMNRSETKSALNISMSFPLINGPRKSKGGMFFIDGGATDNVPVYPMQYFDLDMIIIFHCYPKYRPPRDIIKSGVIVIDVDVTLSLDKRITSFSFSREAFAEMIEKARLAGKKFADYVFSSFDGSEVEKRCDKYRDQNIEARGIKSKDNLMKLVDILNALYSVKGYYP
ncbi:MAG: patatin-like phospholipase family protein [Bacilli bacterium]|jgi:predicted acylesterase/phospholipase RssA